MVKEAIRLLIREEKFNPRRLDRIVDDVQKSLNRIFDDLKIINSATKWEPEFPTKGMIFVRLVYQHNYYISIMPRLAEAVQEEIEKNEAIFSATLTAYHE